jgi:hypothetical protein
MDARSVWFRETGEGRPKEQLLIETMFCVYYLSKGSAVRVTRAVHLQPPFLNTFSSSVPSCGSRTSPVGHRQRVSRPARQPSPWSLPPCLILTPSAISPAPTPKHAASFLMLPPGKERASNPGCLKRIALASMSEDHQEGIEAFLGRRKPRFKGRQEVCDRKYLIISTLYPKYIVSPV